MLIWHVGFLGKIRYLHRHFYSFLEPQHIKQISELFIENSLINSQSLLTCQAACESEYIIFALHNRGLRQHSLLQCVALFCFSTTQILVNIGGYSRNTLEYYSIRHCQNLVKCHKKRFHKKNLISLFVAQFTF
jgi:hypothetical protein